ncbi:urea ABC transporter ATP-binding protein UrtD [Paenibacillus pasadenensis]|uniref:urea ABC transporter ATP-binding protein UrtD n=1 Tax=Paenibacillus pasadenensis TaxID=217090 RepID=UPI00203A46C7|nr:urea ABC transporter ATP-binding protein UrtD [Paenibacillus pasadenensis]MCM3750049.1 urea ABC transporter ATP-binding protein UrtD [Paenibacillus pasadenensis]
MSDPVILRCEDVTVSFDGFKAVQGMNLVLGKSGLRFLIGPNGAGKTTMLDAICGKVKPSGGSILYREEIDLAKRKEHQIAELGVGRKFQAPSIFPSLSVEENLELAMRQDRGITATLRAKLRAADRKLIGARLESIGLGGKQKLRAGSLSHGEKQWLEIGMMLLQEPSLLLLDEPAAGMTDRETEKTGVLLQEIARDRAVVVVEHDMEFVRNFASIVTVMHEGRLLMEGTMDQVQADERVAEVYLGKRREAAC